MNELETLDARMLYARAQQLIGWKRYKEALQELEQILRMEPENPDAMAMIANVYLLQNEYDKSLHWAGMVLGREPDHLLAWYVRVCVFYETDRDKEFDEAVEYAMRIDPDEPHYYFLKANRVNKRGAFKEARALLDEALRLSPEHPLYLAMASYTEALMGRFDESRQLERRAMPYSVEEPHALLYLSWAARTRGDYDQQEIHMRNAVRLNPENKQFRDEYLEALQYSNRMYRFFLWPIDKLRRLKNWQIFLAWVVAWIFFRYIVILFIILYVLAHWISRAIVHVRVFGWRRGT